MTPSEFELVFVGVRTGSTFIKAEWKVAVFLQPARCTNVARLDDEALHSGVVSEVKQ